MQFVETSLFTESTTMPWYPLNFSSAGSARVRRGLEVERRDKFVSGGGNFTNGL